MPFSRYGFLVRHAVEADMLCLHLNETLCIIVVSLRENAINDWFLSWKYRVKIV